MMTRAMVSIGLLLSGITTADAEWRYCYSLDAGAHRLYVSAPFSTSSTMDPLERSFREVLARQAVIVQQVACPRGDDREAVIGRIARAAAYNSDLGNETVRVPWPATVPTAGR